MKFHGLKSRECSGRGGLPGMRCLDWVKAYTFRFGEGAENIYTLFPGFGVKNALWGRRRAGAHDRHSRKRARKEGP